MGRDRGFQTRKAAILDEGVDQRVRQGIERDDLLSGPAAGQRARRLRLGLEDVGRAGDDLQEGLFPARKGMSRDEGRRPPPP